MDAQTLFGANYLRLVRLARQLVDDQDSAEDLVQDVFAALQSRPSMPQDPKRYLQTAVVNRSRSLLRRRRVARAIVASREEPTPAADASSLQRDERSTVLTAIDRLPRRQKEVVVLRYYEDLDVTGIAGVLGISPGAVSASLARALGRLSDLLAGGS